MQIHYLNNILGERVVNMKLKYNEKCRRKFLRKKYSHMKKQNLKDFFDTYCIKEFSNKISEIDFRCYFSFYLYLYLKAIAEGYDPGFTISGPIAINLTEISRQAGISRNTVKAASRELTNVGLIIYNDDIKLPNNGIKHYMLLNDSYLLGFDSEEGKIIYSIKAFKKES